MNAAGVAWVFSSHTMNNKSARKSEGRPLVSGTNNVFTGAKDRVGIHQSPVQKLNCRHWTKKLLLAFKALVISSVDIWKKIPSVAGQRDIDQLQVKQLTQELNCSDLPCVLNSDELKSPR